MAGDHKCPVCQATFTRPQHVARHMRSHTGDRPYKCQHCGDQFARSDLLSRHINKCHANEKPPVTTAPNQRRKGAAAACRATTSKQACDQCVTSTLPCDGANPCSKCVQRKCRCTYVKFHRQTAPAGPGHQAPVRAPSELDSPLPPYGSGARYAQSAEYQLPLPGSDALAMGAANNNSALAALYGPAHHPYPFNPTMAGYAPSAHDAATAAALGAAGASLDPAQADFVARYRQQTELLRRAGVLPSTNVGIAPDITNALNSGLSYAEAVQQQQHHGRYSQQQQQHQQELSHWERTQQQQHQAQQQSHNQTPYGASDKTSIGTFDQYGYIDPSARHQVVQQRQQQQQQQYPYYHTRNPSEPDNRRNSYDLSGGESSVNGSLSSAASSNARLPLEGRSAYSASSTRPSTAESPSAGSRALPAHGQQQQHHQNGHGRHESGSNHDGFSSAFGLMSLDDPNVLAGLANDAQPFFSGMGLPTPTPAKEREARARAYDSLFPSRGEEKKLDMPASNGLTPRELETRELRDFWKQYMRTPLTGGGPLGATPGFSSLTSILGDAGPSRPGPPKRGLSRVASLPSVKTPGIGLRESFDAQEPIPPPVAAGRTYTAADDLKSYEAAVLSRRAPMTLSLQPRRGRAGSTIGLPGLTGGSPTYSDAHNGSSASPEHHYRTATAEPNRQSPATMAYGGSRAPSAYDYEYDARMRPPPDVPDTSLRHASVATDEGSAGSDTDGSGGNVARPNFKRLASQTLGPEHAKRTALAGALGDEEEDAYDHAGPQRMTIGLPERYRRLSQPTASPASMVGGYA